MSDIKCHIRHFFENLRIACVHGRPADCLSSRT